MCSSYTTKSKTNKEEYQKAYGLPWDIEDANNTDAYTDDAGQNSIGFPGIKMPVITIEKPNVIQDYEFGFVPHWMSSEKISGIRNTFNARIETITKLATWRDAWQNAQRCLVCTNGFYEHDKKRKMRVFIHLKEEENFYYGGIYNNWINKQTGEVHKTMAVITTYPNELVAKVHHRQPVIIQKGHEATWMDPSADTNHLLIQYGHPLSASFMELDDVIDKPKKNSGQTELF